MAGSSFDLCEGEHGFTESFSLVSVIKSSVFKSSNRQSDGARTGRKLKAAEFRPTKVWVTAQLFTDAGRIAIVFVVVRLT